MNELSFEEVSTVFGGSLPPADIDWWALDDFNREQLEQMMAKFRRRSITG